MLLLGGLDLLHVDQALRRKDPLPRRLPRGPHEALVLGGGEIEPPRGLGVHPEGVHDPRGDVDERARGAGVGWSLSPR